MRLTVAKRGDLVYGMGMLRDLPSLLSLHPVLGVD